MHVKNKVFFTPPYAKPYNVNPYTVSLYPIFQRPLSFVPPTPSQAILKYIQKKHDSSGLKGIIYNELHG